MLSVLIVNWNTKDPLLACLQSLYRHPPAGPFETIVVDNASKDGSADAVRRSFPQVVLLEQARNLGYAAGNNAAFQIAKGDWLLTLNPDTELTDDSLQTAVDTLSTNPKHGALGARLVGTDGQIQRSVRGFPTFGGLVGELAGLWRLFPRSALGSYRLPLFDYDRQQDAPQPMGTFLLLRRSALESVGSPLAPFDTDFPIFFNEVDLLYRLQSAGWRCLYSPAVTVRHLGGESTRQVRKNMIWESHRSLVRYFVKHHRTRWNGWAVSVLAAALYASAFIRARGYHAGFRA